VFRKHSGGQESPEDGQGPFIYPNVGHLRGSIEKNTQTYNNLVEDGQVSNIGEPVGHLGREPDQDYVGGQPGNDPTDPSADRGKQGVIDL